MSYSYSNTLPSSLCPSAGLAALAAEARGPPGHGGRPGLRAKPRDTGAPQSPGDAGRAPARARFLLPKDIRPGTGASVPSPRVPVAAGGGLEGTTQRLINAGEPGLGDSGRAPICGAGAQAGAAGSSGEVAPRVPGPGHP